MKRNLAQLAFFLFLGAIINVAVAWGCVLVQDSRVRHIDARGRLSALTFSNSQNWNFWIVHRSAITTIWWRQELTNDYYNAFVPVVRPSWSTPPPIPAKSVDQFVTWSFVQIGAGWPSISMTCRGDFDPKGNQGTGDSHVQAGLQLREFRFIEVPRILPLRPIWPGFAINTVFYAAILWMIFAAPATLRRRIRAHRGRCIACGYDLRGRDADRNVCPECGAAAPTAE